MNAMMNEMDHDVLLKIGRMEEKIDSINEKIDKLCQSAEKQDERMRDTDLKLAKTAEQALSANRRIDELKGDIYHSSTFIAGGVSILIGIISIIINMYGIR